MNNQGYDYALAAFILIGVTYGFVTSAAATAAVAQGAITAPADMWVQLLAA